MPELNQDIEFPAPEPVSRVRRAVNDADALWIFCPEYNGRYPGHVKTIIDWLSRPTAPTDYSAKLPLNGKKIALSGAGGKGATAGCRAKLTELLEFPFINADVMASPQTGIALNTEAWTEGKMILTDEQLHDIQKQVDAFLDYIAE